MSYDNDNRLALWLNDKREKQTHPHLKGQGEVGSEKWVSAWFAKDIDPDDAKALMGIVKRHRENSKAPFISVSLQDKEKSAPAEPAASNDFNDPIPF